MNPMGLGKAMLQMGFCTLWIANPKRLWNPVARYSFYNMCICEKGMSSLHIIFTFGKIFKKISEHITLKNTSTRVTKLKSPWVPYHHAFINLL